MAQTLSGDKLIFISDIHMGDQRSMATSSDHPYPYGWLIKNIATLTNFLSEQLKAPDVGQVVILGDLFDRWVFPTNFEPPAPVQYLKDICEANQGIIDKLQALAKSGKLSYVPGNHDMSLCQEDIRDFKDLTNSTFDGINFICDKNQPTGVYHAYDNKLVAEHGNMYCVFNASDIWTDPDKKSFLPLGYFISRIVAYEVWKTGKGQSTMDIIYKYIQQVEKKEDFIKKSLIAVAGDAELNGSDQINMGNISGFRPVITIDEVADRYKDLMANWDKDVNHKKNDFWTATQGDTFVGLLWPACAYYVGPGADPTFKVAIFGHTHTSENEDAYPPLPNGNGQENDPSDPSQPCKAIYANCGTWIDATDYCTYIETEVDEDNLYVRRKSYPKDVFGQELFVSL